MGLHPIVGGREKGRDRYWLPEFKHPLLLPFIIFADWTLYDWYAS